MAKEKKLLWDKICKLDTELKNKLKILNKLIEEYNKLLSKEKKNDKIRN